MDSLSDTNNLQPQESAFAKFIADFFVFLFALYHCRYLIAILLAVSYRFFIFLEDLCDSLNAYFIRLVRAIHCIDHKCYSKF